MSVVTGHRHRILFCGPSCYFDDSNDAAIASRGLMETLGRLGFAVEVLTGIVFEVGSGSDTLTVDSLTSDSFSGNDSAVVTPASGAADNITITLSGSDNSSLNETVTTTVSGGGVSSSTSGSDSGSDTFDLSESDGTNTYTEDDSDSYDDPIGGSGGTTAANAAASGAGSSGASSGDRSSSHRSGTPPGGWESPGLAFLGGFFGNVWDRATYVPSTVWSNTGTSDSSLAGRIYVTAGTTVGSLVGVTNVSDAFSQHDAVDGHLQTTGERIGKGVIGGVQLATAGVVGAASVSARASVGGWGNIGSHTPVSPDFALQRAETWLGAGYKEIKPDIFRSADGWRQFRMRTADLIPTHGKIGPHVHFEALDAAGGVIENLHLPLLP